MIKLYFNHGIWSGIDEALIILTSVCFPVSGPLIGIW
jgi:hypothetical protein